MKRFLRLMVASVAAAVLLGPPGDPVSAQGVKYSKIGKTSRSGGSGVNYTGKDRRFSDVGGYKYRRNKYKRAPISDVGRRSPTNPNSRAGAIE